MGFLRRGTELMVRDSRPPQTVERQSVLSVDDWIQQFTYGANQYQYGIVQNSLSQVPEEIGADWGGYVGQAFKQCGPVFSCVLARMLVFSEARFQWQRLREGRPGELFGTSDLAILERPWPNGTTAGLLKRMELDSSLAGNFYARRTVINKRPCLERLRPDWVTIIAGSQRQNARIGDPGVQVVGYEYRPGGPAGDREPYFYGVDEVVHFAPIPDPDFAFRGMSWLTPVIQEILADKVTTQHKINYFTNGAQVPHVIILDKDVSTKAFEYFQSKFREQHVGTENAWNTLFLGGGADLKTIGTNLRDADVRQVLAGGETRIAAAARVPAIIAGLSEGLQASSQYSNYASARRHFADMSARPWWRDAAGSLESILDPRADARLWYDDRDIASLQEDMSERSAIQATQASAIRQLTDAGFEADTVVSAVTAGDLTRLKHTGLFSVQLRPPGSEEEQAPAEGAASTNGSGNAEAVPAPVAEEE